MEFFPAGSDPGFVLYATEFFMRVYKMQVTTENEIAALESIQRTYSPDVLFPRMDLNEFAWLFADRGITDLRLGRADVDWSSYTPDAIIRTPARAEMEASHSVEVLREAGDDTLLKARFLGAVCPAPYSLVTGIIGLAEASKFLIRNRSFLSALVTRAGEALNEYARVLQEVADVVVILAPSECTISRKMYEATSKEPVQQLVETVASDPDIASFFHLCTRTNEHIMNEDIIAPLARAGLTGLNVPNVLGAIPLAQALDLVVLGGIDPVGVQQYPWQEVLQQTRVILEQTQEIRFILGTDCHLMKIPRLEPSGTLLTKFLELKKLIREYSGKGPEENSYVGTRSHDHKNR